MEALATDVKEKEPVKEDTSKKSKEHDLLGKPKSAAADWAQSSQRLGGQSKTEEPKKTKEIVKSYLLKERVLTENTDAARELYNQSRYGKMLGDGRVQLAFTEAMYLLERGKIAVFDGKGKPVTAEQFLKKAAKAQQNFWVKYSVFKDIRDRGYIIKTALKFGADFRVYDRGVKPGEDHARWILYPVHEGDTLTWHEFSAKNRVAHSTKKRLLIGVVDEEADVSYWEVRWMRP